MQRHLVSVFTLLVLTTTSVTAAPMGYLMPRTDKYSIGAYIGLDNRNLRSSNDGERIDATQRYAMVDGTYALTENIEFRGGIGVATLDMDGLADFHGDPGVAGRFGFGSTLWSFEKFSLVGLGNYMFHRGHTGTWTGSVNSNLHGDNKTDFWEWDVAVQAQRNADELSKIRFLPYAGIRYSGSRIKVRTRSGQPMLLSYDGVDNIGFYAGTAYRFGEKLLLGIEGSLMDAPGVSVGLTFLE